MGSHQHWKDLQCGGTYTRGRIQTTKRKAGGGLTPWDVCKEGREKLKGGYTAGCIQTRKRKGKQGGLTCQLLEKSLVSLRDISEVFPTIFSDHFTFEFRFHQFSKANLTLTCLRYTSDKEKTTCEIQILPTVKFSLHILISLLSLKNWEVVISDGVRFFMHDS